MNKLGAYQKKLANIANVTARYEFLVQTALLPGRVSKTVAKALQGQRAFCALLLPDSNIAPLSLNTYKTRARELYATDAGASRDGFVFMEALRVAAVAAIEKSHRATAGGNGSEESVREDGRQQQIRQLEVHTLRQSKAYLDLHGKIIALAKEPGIDDLSRLRLLKVLQAHQAVFGDLLNPATATQDDVPNVVPMRATEK
ncbi:hypothetical protein [Duganella sp. LjRoot269]|uniref:hypothetical protein n=1 Tax=Duganella sp. LjRoot269 TaxID=3342305 RepID=UPI003ECD1102